MRNDVGVPPPDPNASSVPLTPAPRANGRAEASRPHALDRAHGLDKLSDKTTTGIIYETPEDRGGIDSLTLSIVVVAGVAVALLIVAYLFYSRL